MAGMTGGRNTQVAQRQALAEMERGIPKEREELVQWWLERLNTEGMAAGYFNAPIARLLSAMPDEGSLQVWAAKNPKQWAEALDLLVKLRQVVSGQPDSIRGVTKVAGQWQGVFPQKEREPA